MDYTIIAPQKGKVTLILDWQEAEIVTRLIGMANHGNLGAHSPNLVAMLTGLLESFGRNLASESNRYTANIQGGQVYLFDKDGMGPE